MFWDLPANQVPTQRKGKSPYTISVNVLLGGKAHRMKGSEGKSERGVRTTCPSWRLKADAKSSGEPATTSEALEAPSGSPTLELRSASVATVGLSRSTKMTRQMLPKDQYPPPLKKCKSGKND